MPVRSAWRAPLVEAAGLVGGGALVGAAELVGGAELTGGVASNVVAGGEVVGAIPVSGVAASLSEEHADAPSRSAAATTVVRNWATRPRPEWWEEM